MMHFFKKIINLDLIEKIEWAGQMDFLGFTRGNIESCILQFHSGKILRLNRQAAQDLFDYLESRESQAPWHVETAEEREQKIREIINQPGGYGSKSIQAQPPEEE